MNRSVLVACQGRLALRRICVEKGFIPQQKYVNNSACESDYSFFETVVYTTKGKSLLLKALKDNNEYYFVCENTMETYDSLVYEQFPVFRGRLQGGFLECFDLLF